MKRYLTTILLVFLFFIGSGIEAKSKKKPVDKIKFPEINKFQLPEIQKATTTNGIKIRLIKTGKLPLVDIRILIRGGDVYDPADKVGLAELTAQLLRIGGTREMKGDDVDQFLDSNGITIGINSADDYYTVNLSCLHDNLDKAILILSKMFRQPAFDPEKLEELKTKGASVVSRRNDEPSPINSREFNKLIYGAKSPFAAVLEYEHLDNISGNDIARIHKMFFAPSNILVGITGPVEISKVKAIFEKYFGKWNNPPAIPPYPSAKVIQHDFKVAFAEKSTLTQSYLSIGHLGVKENLAERGKIMVFNSIFSQGFASRLMRRVRVKMGLTYGIGGGVITEYLYPGKTYFSTFTKSKSTLKAIKAIFDEINIIRKEKVTPVELKSAKDYFINSFVFKYSSPDRIMNSELAREFYNLPEGYSQKLIEDIKKVNADDVFEVSQRYLDPEKMIVFILGKEKDLDGKLKELGKVKKIDISIPPPTMKEKIPAPTAETLSKGKALITKLSQKAYRGYRGLKSLEIKAERKISMQGRTIPLNTTSTVLYPDKSYTEISVMGMKMEYIINGNQGLSKQMGNVKPVPEKDIKEGRFSDLYQILKVKKNYQFQYLKEETVEGKTYDVIYIFDQDKNWVKLFVNQKSQMIEIEEKISKMPGASGIAREIKSDFKKVSGIPFAFKSKTYVKDKVVSEVTVKQIKVNPQVDLKIFKIEKK